MSKSKSLKIFIAFSAFLCLLLVSAWSFVLLSQQQSKEQLNDKKKQIESEISYYKKLLEETKNNKNVSVNQLVLLKNQISKRENLIDEINTEISDLDQSISKNYEEIVQSNKQTCSLKEEYARMVYCSYKNRKAQDRLMFIFSANDLSQAHRRIKYLQQYNDYLQQRVQLIQKYSNDILVKNQELMQQKDSKQQLLVQSEKEKQQLALEKSKKDEDVNKLKQKESEIKKTIKQKESEAQALKKQIESAIKSAIVVSAKKTNQTVTNTTTVKNVLTPEEKIESDNFAGNKGHLPWPVERGVISSSYGEHPHPVLTGVVIKNNGIDISTSANTSARAIFKGTVTGVVTITNQNKAVIIRHGEFFTVYSNLKSVSVSKNQQVASKQIIGVINTDPDDNKTELHFEIWQGNTICNPQSWIAGH